MSRLCAITLFTVAGCGQFGPSPAASLPADAHARPSAAEVAEHPCRYGDFAGCVARCNSRDAQACNGVGVLIEFAPGEDRPSDPALASEYYERSCNDNYGPGCNNLAWLYLRGNGVARDQPHAMRLFMAAFDAARLACAHGDPSGCLLAGELLFDGRGVPEDEDAALAYFERASLQVTSPSTRR